MRFTTHLLTVSVSAVLVTVASCAAIDSKVVARDGPFDDITAPQASWDKMVALCNKGRDKRDLQARDDWPPKVPDGFTLVAQGRSMATMLDSGLWTYGLVTCFGVGVTGKVKNSNNLGRCLLHLEASNLVLNEEWNDFQEKVTDLNLEKMEGWMSTPDRDHETPSGWNDDDKKLSKDIFVKVEKLLKTITGSDPVVVTHPMQSALDKELPHGTMWIDKTNAVTIEGATVPPPTGTTSNLPPQPKQGLTCTGTGVNKFLSQPDLATQIGIFCAAAAEQGVQDLNSGSIQHTYLSGTRYQLSLSIDWPSGQDIKANMQANCMQYMTSIMNDCDGNDPQNPLDWKHGGTYGVGSVVYHVTPLIDQGYKPGVCAFRLQEDESWSGVDGPGTERHWSFALEKCTMVDAAKATIGTMTTETNAGAGNPFNWQSKLPLPLAITPEAQDGDYIQFTIGGQSWTSKDTGKVPGCNVGALNSDYSPDYRNMDCLFNC